MNLLYKGKTKDVYDLNDGTILLKFKDDGTVNDDGVFDPGGNTVGVHIEGMGHDNLKLTKFFFEKIAEAGVPSHYITCDLNKNTMLVQSAHILGHGLEVICRFVATGSYIRRYGAYIQDGDTLDGLVEFTIKDDHRGDPPISRESLIALGIMNDAQYDAIISLTKQIAVIIKNEIAQKGGTLLDIKLEFGLCKDKIMLIDEISGGCMRVQHHSKMLTPHEIVGLMLS